MTEERFAAQVRQALNHNLDDIPPTALRRMEAARHHALAHQKQAEVELVTATSSPVGAIFSNPRVRQSLAAIALLLGMGIAAYWQASEYILDLEEVDSALLADELPPEAFMDKGFSAWLKDDSSE